MRANVAQVQAYLSESTDIIYHFPEHTHNVCMLQLSTRTHTNTYTFLRIIHTHTHLNCIHHHIYLPQEIHGGSSKHIYMCNERVYGFPSLLRGYTDRFDGDVCAQHATIALHSSQTISASLSAA